MSPSNDVHPTELISAYLDGAAGPEEQVQVEEHLRICPRCREMVEDFHILAATTAREEPPPLPPDLAARIRRRMEEEKGRRSPSPRRTWQRPFALGAAAGLAVATLVWLAVRPQAPTSLPVTKPTAQKPAVAIPPAAPEAKQTEGNKEAKYGARKEAAPAGTKTKAGDLRSLGYAQGGADKANALKDENAADLNTIPGAVPGSVPSEEALQTGRERDEAGADDSLAARSDEPAPVSRSKEKRSSSRALEAQLASESARESGVAGAATGPRSLLYETPDLSVTFSEEGMVTLVLRGYACSVSLASPATKESETSPAPELAPLFTQASSREILAAVAPTGKTAAPSAEAEAPRLKTLTLRNPRGGNIYAVSFGDSPETAPPRPVLDLEEEMRRVLALRFRKALEDRCGPIPDDSALVGP